jgi:hypothetical protein
MPATDYSSKTYIGRCASFINLVPNVSFMVTGSGRALLILTCIVDSSIIIDWLVLAECKPTISDFRFIAHSA